MFVRKNHWQRTAVIDMETADCEFIVGDDKKVLKCSRFLLGLASPVFNAMFKGGGFGNPILVPDVESRVFEKMLRFLSEKIEFESKDEVAEICVLARRYRIQDLVNLCSDHLQPQSLKDFWRALDCAVSCNMRPLKDDLMEVNKFIHEVKSHDNDSVLKQQISPFTDNLAWRSCQDRCSESGNSRTAEYGGKLKGHPLL